MNPVYSSDKRVAELCRDMSIAGFMFDVDRAKKFSAFLLEKEQEARDRADRAVGRPIKSGPSGGFSTKDLAVAYFKDLGARPVAFSAITGRPSLNVDALRAYAASQREELRALSVAVLEFRRARKVRATYVDAVIPALDSQNRIHPSWLSYGTETGRLSCQGPNLANLPSLVNDPTASMGGIRSLYMAPDGRALVVWDAKQLEMRVAAYVTGDEAMIEACNAEDLHSANAVICFGEDFVPARYAELSGRKDRGEELAEGERLEFIVLKGLRTLAKSAGFAVCYYAEAETVWARIKASGQADVSLREVSAMLSAMHRRFSGYYRWQEANYLKIMRTGYAYSPIFGRPRWLSHDPEVTKSANYPIQSGAADLMNLKLPQIEDALRIRVPGARIVAQVYDAAAIECDRSQAEEVAEISRQIFQSPIVISTSGRPLEARFPIDVDKGERWH